MNRISVTLAPLLSLLAPVAVDAAETAGEAATQLAPVLVTAGQTGTAEEGYRVSAADLGPLGTRPVQDLPYAVHSLPAALIQDQQVDGTPDLLKYLPSTQVEYRGGGEIGRPQSRGFQADLLQNSRIDGYSVGAHFPQPVELYERQDVLYGLAGALYGPANAAGIFNSILKRPTDTTRIRVSETWEEASHLTSRLDAGGRIGPEDRIGYRLNLMHGDGERYTDTSQLRRELAGIALDGRLSDTTLLELNASRYIYDQTGYPGNFAIAADLTRLPEAPDPERAGFGQPFANATITSDLYGVRLTRELSDEWQLRLGLQQQNVLRELHSAGNTLGYVPASDDFSVTVKTSEGYTKQRLLSNQLALNGRFTAWGLLHEPVIGTNGYKNPSFKSSNPAVKASSCTGTLDAPCTLASEPAWNGYGSFNQTGETRYQNLLLGDTVTFNERWSAMGVINNSWIASDNALKPELNYRDHDALSYSAALMYKPRANMSTYINHSRGVQPGGTAKAGTANEGETLKPYRTYQYEVGYKLTLEQMDLSAAAFQITRPLAYADSDNIYREQGRQENRGLELMAKGKAGENTTLFGGVTYLDPVLHDTKLAETDGKQVIGVPEWQANLLVAYEVAQLPGLGLNGNLHYTGKRAANNTNTLWADGYTTLDLGARYRTKIQGTPLTWRLGINNVTDERYWTSLMPGNTEGDTTAGASAFLGEPRTVKASIQLDF